MNEKYIINLLFFALGVASCLFILFSIFIRIVKHELKEMKEDFLKQVKEGKISTAH